MRKSVAGSVLVLAIFAGAAFAATPADVAKERQANFKEIGKNMKAIADNLKSGAANPKLIADCAKKIDELAPHIPSWFPAGTGPGQGFKTQAKAEIWQRPEEFQKDARDMAAQADKLYMVASSGGTVPQIISETKALGETCKTCHTTFREKED